MNISLKRRIEKLEERSADSYPGMVMQQKEHLECNGERYLATVLLGFPPDQIRVERGNTETERAFWGRVNAEACRFTGYDRVMLMPDHFLKV